MSRAARTALCAAAFAFAAAIIWLTAIKRIIGWTPAVSATAAALLLALLFLWEHHPAPLSELLPAALLAAAAAAGRLLFAFAPQLQPATALIIIAGACLGARAGCICGVLCALISNLALGQGPWTLFQMLGWGLVGLLSALLRGRPLWLVCLWGVLSAAMYSLIVDIWSVAFLGAAGLPALLAVWGAGLLANIPHAVGNVLFLLPLYPYFSRIFIRLHAKYSSAGL